MLTWPLTCFQACFVKMSGYMLFKSRFGIIKKF